MLVMVLGRVSDTWSEIKKYYKG